MKRLVLALWLLAAPAWGQQITALPAAGTPLSGTEQIYLVQGGISKQTTIGNLFNAGNVFSTLTVTNGAAIIGGGLVIGSPPGGNLGAGTVNATAYFLNGLPFTGGGGGGSVCGATGQVQFNNAGTFGCDSTFTFNSTTKLITGQALVLNSNSSAALSVGGGAQALSFATTGAFGGNQGIIQSTSGNTSSREVRSSMRQRGRSCLASRVSVVPVTPPSPSTAPRRLLRSQALGARLAFWI